MGVWCVCLKLGCLLVICGVNICGLFDFVLLLVYVVYGLIGDLLFLCVVAIWCLVGFVGWLFLLLLFVWFDLVCC